MKTTQRYVLFYCDDCDQLQPAIAIFQDLHPSVSVHTTSDMADLRSKIELIAPELLLVYLHDQSKDYMHLIKEVRNSTQTSNVPVLIYREMPDEDGLRNAFNKIRRY